MVYIQPAINCYYKIKGKGWWCTLADAAAGAGSWALTFWICIKLTALSKEMITSLLYIAILRIGHAELLMHINTHISWQRALWRSRVYWNRMIQNTTWGNSASFLNLHPPNHPNRMFGLEDDDYVCGWVCEFPKHPLFHVVIRLA